MSEFNPLYGSIAVKAFEIAWGADSIVRVNVDGICVLRVRLGPDCRVQQRGDGLTLDEMVRLLDNKGTTS